MADRKTPTLADVQAAADRARSQVAEWPAWKREVDAVRERTPAEILVARLAGVDDPAERVRIVAEALDEARRAGVEAERTALARDAVALAERLAQEARCHQIQYDEEAARLTEAHAAAVLRLVVWGDD